MDTHRGCKDRFYLPSIAEVQEVLGEEPDGFVLERVEIPSYEFGDQCPTVSLRRR
jgi:hypothetical protein